MIYRYCFYGNITGYCYCITK